MSDFQILFTSILFIILNFFQFGLVKPNFFELVHQNDLFGIDKVRTRSLKFLLLLNPFVLELDVVLHHFHHLFFLLLGLNLILLLLKFKSYEISFNLVIFNLLLLNFHLVQKFSFLFLAAQGFDIFSPSFLNLLIFNSLFVLGLG